MSKTKYPNQIDTPAELPIVRDNIFEIGSDAINSLRSAIIQIEKTLGVNPQGTIGLTVGERISQSLDSSGNIKKEALDIAGIISGPIFDDQISDTAAIREYKLKLNIPTQVLQSEISSLLSVIDEIQSQIEQISSKLSAHLSPDAANRHSAKSISTASIEATTSAVGIKSIAASNVQSVLDGIFSSHINYDGTSISEINNSHTANQIFYDNTNITNISSSNVQDAITDVASFLQVEVSEHQKLLHSNGFANSSYIQDLNNDLYGTVVLSSGTSSVFKNLGEKSYFEIILDSPILKPDLFIGLGDIVELTLNSVKQEFQIYKVNYDTLEENITGFLLFGIISSNEIVTPISIFLRRYRSYNSLGLLSNNREMYGLSSSSLIQIMNPDSAFIQTSGINPVEISASNRYFDLKINGTTYSFDVYNSTITKQSIDSVIKAINETVDSLGLPILAYRVNKSSGGSEVVIAHNISSLDDGSSSLEIVRVDGAIDSLGFSNYENKIIYGQPGSSYYISGKKYTGLLKKLDLSGFSLQSGSVNISSGALGVSFFDYEIKKGDIVNIIDTICSSYEITEVTSSYISVSSRQLPVGFTTATSGTTRLVVYESTVDLKNSEFLKVGIISSSSVGSSLFEIFLDENRKISSNLILEQESGIYFDKSIYEIIDYKNSLDLESSQIKFENSEESGETCVYVWLDENTDKKKIVGNNNYITLKSNLKNFECTIYVHDISALYNYAFGLGGSFSKSIYLASKINKENNLIISNVHYVNALGRVAGGISGSLFISKLNFGNLDEKDISTALKYNLNQLPISELRSSGVIHGLKISSVSNPDGYSSGQYLISIDSGICYVNGRRFEILGVENYDSGVDAGIYDKVYVGIDTNGNFVFSGPDPSCSYPWAEEDTLLLGTIENNDSSYRIIDQRLFINNIDLKLLNSITVSPQPGMGHFTDIKDAVAYAKRFGEIFPKAGTPEVHLKSGKFYIEIEDQTTEAYGSWLGNLSISGSQSRINFFNNIIKYGLFIDFPVVISGEGSSTEIECVYKITSSDTISSLTLGIFVAGYGFNTAATSATENHNRFSIDKIIIKNLKITEGWILLSDLILPSDGEYRRVDIDNIIFNDLNIDSASKKVFTFNSKKIYGITLLEIDNSTDSKGGLSVKDCIFNNGGKVILLPDTSPSRYYEIDISNCHGESADGLSDPNFINSSKFPSNLVSYFSNTGKYSSSRHTKTQENLYVSGALSVKNSAIISSGGLIVAGTTAISGSTIVSSNISVLGTTGSGDVSAKSFTVSGLNNLIRTISMTDFYSVIQLPSAAYTNSNATWGYGSGATQLDIPGQVTLQNSGSYIWIVLDSYLINNATLESIKLVCSSSSNLTMQMDIYESNSIGSNGSPTFVDSDSNIINNLAREELIFNFNYLYLEDKICYLKIGISSGTGNAFLYKLSLLINTSNSISTSLNLI